MNEGSQLYLGVHPQEIPEEVYFPLYTAIRLKNWAKAQKFLNKHTHAKPDIKLNQSGETTLHVAVGTPENIEVLENLLKQIDPKSIVNMVNKEGHNPLHYAAILGNTFAARKLVETYPDLLFIVDQNNRLPIDIAIYNSHIETFTYLLQTCKEYITLSEMDGYCNPFTRALILQNTISAGLLDVAYKLLKDYPELALTNTSWSPLYQLAEQQDAYPSAKRYNCYQRFVYSHVPAENYDLCNTNKSQDIENQETYMATRETFVDSVIRRIFAKFWEVALHAPHIKRLDKDKEKHKIALTVLKFICEQASKLNFYHYPHYEVALFVAVKCDIPEVVEQITQSFPHSIWAKNENRQSLFQVSILNRCEKVYNFLVHKVTHDKYLHNVIVDNDGNNLLHLSGYMAPSDKLHLVTGAALQMQRELEWFQAVSNLVPPKEREAKNAWNDTPSMVFRKTHQDLRQKGENWMKKTAESYSITAGLITTVVFAAAITVPGGNNGTTGRAIYRTYPSYIVFIISDAISLFTSTTSLLFFLSILTARYAENDFLHKLPKSLIRGVMMLFVSVTSMMIAFSATLYIMSGQEHAWILILIAVATCLPIALFVILQLPLHAALASSTYGPGIFKKQNEFMITDKSNSNLTGSWSKYGSEKDMGQGVDTSEILCHT